MQVNLKGSVSVQGNGALTGTPGSWVKHYTYDGLGRLIRTQSPWPWPDANPIAAQSERHYYDGFRRIQKVLVDPIAVDDDKEPIKINKEVDLTRVNVQYNATVNREYVWDIADTDRLLCQYSSSGTPFFVATDESWTPVAQLDTAGHVTDQFNFDPYGTLLSYDDTSYDRPMLEVGHQGLFFDRLDVPLLDSDGSENPRLAANAAGIYYNRARTYSPSLGRFLQADPNATGMATNDLQFGGRLSQLSRSTSDIRPDNQDGPNRYSYLRNRPTVAHDSSGLEYSLSVQLPTAQLNASITTTHNGAVAGATGGAVTAAAPALAGGLPGLGGAGAGGAQLTGAKAFVAALAAGAIVFATGAGPVYFASSGSDTPVPRGEQSLPAEVQAAAASLDSNSYEPLDWSKVNWKGQSAYDHVQDHGEDNKERDKHSVFNDDPVYTTLEAWQRVQLLKISPIRQRNGNDCYVVSMGRAVGWKGGSAGTGQPFSNVTIIVVPSTNQVVTAYPSP